MHKKLILFSTLFSSLIALLFISCEKEITVDLPVVEPKIVVEGFIFNDQPPIVMLTWSQGYFKPINATTLANMYVHDATVSINDGFQTYPLIERCTNELSEAELELASQALGIPVSQLIALNLCVYVPENIFDLVGIPGRVYTLNVDYQEHQVSASTKVCEVVALDSVWFKIVSTIPDDSLGFIFGTLTDPDTLGNAYRWYAKRINHYPAWAEDEELIGTQKDFNYIAPIGSALDDAFYNGLSFEFGYYRGSEPNSNKFDDLNNERGFFKKGDTIAIRGCSIDKKAYDFIASLEDQAANQGSPFSIPFNLKSNVTGGLGAFIGYAATYDTVICQ